MNCNLKVLFKVYLKRQNRGYDWMGFKLQRTNPDVKLSYHHIFKAVYGEYGVENKNYIVMNGALLTVASHQLLHYLEGKNKGAYNKINGVFLEHSIKKEYPKPKDIVYIQQILKDASKYNEEIKEKVLTYQKKCRHVNKPHYLRMQK